MKIFFVFTLFLSIFSFEGYAKSLELKKHSRSIYIKEKSGWKLGKDLFGMPFVYFAPKMNGQSSNISFTDTGANLELDVKSLALGQTSYENDRKKWAESIGASISTFFPYEIATNQYGHKVHQIGFNYSYQGRKYKEKSYYIECRGKIINSKSLRLFENEKHDKDFNDLISSLDCGGV